MAPVPTIPTLLCPLAAERAALLRAARRIAPRLAGCRCEVSGPGAAAISRWFERTRPAGPVVLVGTAGGLTPEALSGSARVIARLVDPLGALLPFPTFAAAASTWTAVGVDRPVATPEGKRALATASGADVVDMESHRFASEAVARGVPFAIVRGVSDGVDDALPAGVERLVDRSGRTRIAAAIGLLVRRPGLVGPLKRLGQRTAAAMESAARTLDTLLPRESSSDR